MRARVIQVIETVETRGAGTEGDPFRRVLCYYAFGGKLLAERDPHPEHELGVALKRLLREHSSGAALCRCDHCENARQLLMKYDPKAGHSEDET